MDTENENGAPVTTPQTPSVPLRYEETPIIEPITQTSAVSEQPSVFRNPQLLKLRLLKSRFRVFHIQRFQKRMGLVHWL